MPVGLVASLIGAFVAAMGSMAGRVLIALGIGFVTYKGIDTGIEALKTQAINGLKGLPADALNLVAYLWLDKALTVIFSAVVVVLSMRAVGGSVKRMVAK